MIFTRRKSSFKNSAARGRMASRIAARLVLGSALIAVVCLIASSALVYFIEKRANSPFCNEESCRNKDPYGTNCYSDHVTVRTIPVQVKEESGTLTLVYSPKCRSNWVKWEGETGAKNRLTVWRKGSPGDPVTTARRFDGDNSGQNTWSNMISAEGDTCVKIKFQQSGQESEDTCTDGLG